jgi:hypothetical protein
LYCVIEKYAKQEVNRMQDKYLELVKGVTKLFNEGKSKEDIIERAREAKRQLSEEWNDVSQAMNLIDSFVVAIAPDIEWQRGFWTPLASGTIRINPGISPRPLRASSADTAKTVLEFATYLKATGNNRISTNTIVDRLRSQGDQRSPHDIATSAGNILSRSKKWKRVSAGEYEVIEAELKEQKELEKASTK